MHGNKYIYVIRVMFPVAFPSGVLPCGQLSSACSDDGGGYIAGSEHDSPKKTTQQKEKQRKSSNLRRQSLICAAKTVWIMTLQCSSHVIAERWPFRVFTTVSGGRSRGRSLSSHYKVLRRRSIARAVATRSRFLAKMGSKQSSTARGKEIDANCKKRYICISLISALCFFGTSCTNAVFINAGALCV